MSTAVIAARPASVSRISDGRRRAGFGTLSTRPRAAASSTMRCTDCRLIACARPVCGTVVGPCSCGRSRTARTPTDSPSTASPCSTLRCTRRYSGSTRSAPVSSTPGPRPSPASRRAASSPWTPCSSTRNRSAWHRSIDGLDPGIPRRPLRDDRVHRAPPEPGATGGPQRDRHGHPPYAPGPPAPGARPANAWPTPSACTSTRSRSRTRSGTTRRTAPRSPTSGT